MIKCPFTGVAHRDGMVGYGDYFPCDAHVFLYFNEVKPSTVSFLCFIVRSNPLPTEHSQYQVFDHTPHCGVICIIIDSHEDY